jgi:uncharacterized protein YcaQ
MPITLNDLRRFTVARNFFPATTLKRALDKMSFVQADPIRSPARAQDLILRQRVRNYRVGDLERKYTTLDVEEDVFVNYGYVTRSLQALMHPRSDSRVPADDIGQPWPKAQQKQAKLLLEFVRARDAVHPREVDDYFAHGKVTNYWGGSSNATTHLLDAMHYRGMLRVVRREKGIRIYAAHEHEAAVDDEVEQRNRMDALIDIVVRIYAPLPATSLAFYIRRLRFAVPQWRDEVMSALVRAKERLAHARVDGIEWYWNADEVPSRTQKIEDRVRLLAPFDPVVHDRARFELLWDWTYRFEAYTPSAKRKLGYYAMPLLWREYVIGWANLSVKDDNLTANVSYVGSPPRKRAFKRELEAELERMRAFLDLIT